MGDLGIFKKKHSKISGTGILVNRSDQDVGNLSFIDKDGKRVVLSDYKGSFLVMVCGNRQNIAETERWIDALRKSILPGATLVMLVDLSKVPSFVPKKSIIDSISKAPRFLFLSTCKVMQLKSWAAEDRNSHLFKSQTRIAT